ncbi:hypothetical protein GWI33_022991 [Rhynchophorus ferrugineus]|uniref:Coilin tudor domain-containing protein n=1 Tax=Rhynchophorus ferrugineus TaxID=354439 RepID=A0A834MKR3_RHYFE|nr:hypothetical protein GWI33_022991 [Rhynchophorus ferrugineus]
MSTNPFFPIIVDLSQFFYDHRRTARIFVNDSIRSVSDLQNRLTQIFSIRDFYLSTGGHFLPESEDIGVLQRNETVCAIPKGPSTDQAPAWEAKNAKQTRPVDLEMIVEENETETLSPRKKKCKKKHRTHTDSCTDNDVHEPRSKKSKRNIDDDVAEHVHKKKKREKERHREACGSESVQTVSAIKKKLREETEKYSRPSDQAKDCSIKTVLPKIQDHIKSCNNFGRANAPEPVRLSRHVDTPISKYTKYVPPSRITDEYLAKNKINIVRIDVVRELDEQATNTSVSESATSSNPTVRELINSFEESSSRDISVTMKDAEKGDDDDAKYSSGAKAANEDSGTNKTENPAEMTSLSVSSTPFRPAADTRITSESSSFSETMELSSIRSDLSAKHDSDLSEIKPERAVFLDSLPEGDKNLRDGITKRKRIRSRKRKKPSRDANETNLNQSLPDVSVRLSGKSVAPSIHIKFDDVDSKNEEKKTDNVENNTQGIKIPPAIFLSDEESVMEIKHIGTDADIANAAAMDDVQPKTGDVIAFKVLKINDDYTPQLSNFVIGRVMLYTLSTNNIFIKILRGRKELQLPSGKLSMGGEDEASQEALRYKEFSWSELTERKLLYSKKSNFIQDQTGGE